MRSILTTFAIAMILVAAFVAAINAVFYAPSLPTPDELLFQRPHDMYFSEPQMAFRNNDTYPVLAANIEEASFVVLLKDYELQTEPSRPYFISLPSQEVPSDALMNRLRTIHLKTERESECYHDAQFGGAIIDKNSKKHGTLFFIKEIKWHNENIAEVTCGYYIGNLAARWQTYSVHFIKGYYYFYPPKIVTVS